MADGMQKDWRELCVAVTNESDSTKLSSLVQQLIEALDQEELKKRIDAGEDFTAKALAPSLVQKLQERGYENVWALQGGFRAWQSAGLPVESKRQAA